MNVAADYSRYLPRGSSPRGIFGWTLFGGAIGPLVLLVFGLLLAGSSKGLVVRQSSLVNVVRSDPLNRSPPDLVMALTTPPVNRPYSAEIPDVDTVVS